MIATNRDVGGSPSGRRGVGGGWDGVVMINHLALLQRSDWAKEFTTRLGSGDDWAADPPPVMRAVRDWLGGTPVILLVDPPNAVSPQSVDGEVIRTVRTIYPDAFPAELADLTGHKLPRVVAIHPDGSLIEALERGRLDIDRLLVVLWRPDEPIARWADVYAETDLARPGHRWEVDENLAVLIEAFRTVEGLEGHHGLQAGDGRRLVVQTLQHLTAGGYDLHPRHLWRAAYRAGLDAEDVESVLKYARQLREGHRFQIGSPRLRSDVLQTWQSRAATEATADS